MEILNTVFYALFVLSMGYYFITNLQWYSYKLTRVLFHHTKLWWHFVYFLFPYSLYMLIESISNYSFVVVLLYMALLFVWYKKLDKPLVFTGRVKRFFAVYIFSAIFLSIILAHFNVIIPLFIAHFISVAIEAMLFNGFKKQAQARLESMENLKVIGITASYGKTSIKNYIAHILSSKYKTYATPRSVNTLGGVMKDINDDLPEDTEIYVVEMGARGEGDIGEISTFVNPHYAIVGKIGPAHIEYFKTLENIRNTKMEILQTSRLEKAWISQSAMVKPEDNILTFGDKEDLDMRTNIVPPKHLIENVESTLNGTKFTLDGVEYKANILGDFNAMNLAVSALVATEFGMSSEEIADAMLTIDPVEHRLQRIDAGGKVILDDSFNGNIDGTMASFKLASTYDGRKVVITPGLVEVDDALNVQVAKKANEIFDLVVVTGELNYNIFKEYVDGTKLLKLDSKDKMQDLLVEHTKSGDLILFANDAPSYI